MLHPVNAYLYYFAVIARNIEGDESDAAIPGGAHSSALRRLRDRFAWVTARDDRWMASCESVNP